MSMQPPSINTTNIDTLLVAAEQSVERAEPPEDLQDKIHFLFNNLSSSNLQEKVPPPITNTLYSTMYNEYLHFVCYVLLYQMEGRGEGRGGEGGGGGVERETHDSVHMAHHNTLY